MHVLVHILHEWYRNTDDNLNKNAIRILLIDFSTTIDRTNPHVLIDKLRSLQIQEILINIISSFLSERRQQVRERYIRLVGNLGKYFPKYLIRRTFIFAND